MQPYARVALVVLCSLYSLAGLQAQEFTRAEFGLESSTLFGNRLQLKTDSGAGGRFTYNLNPGLALEADGNYYFTRSTIFSGQADGRATSAFFGPKAGIRRNRFGLFFKARPGFISFSSVVTSSATPGNITTARKTHAALDLGGVFEFYATKRLILRADLGEVLVRYGDATVFSSPSFQIRTLGAIDDPLHLSVGVSYRLGELRNERKPAAAPDRFQFGLQYSLQTLQRSFFTTRDESAIGGWFTYSFSRHFGLDAAANFFPREQRALDFQQGGQMIQAVAGVRWGVRRDRWGVFLKSRPGVQIYTLTPGFDFRQIFDPHQPLPSFANLAFDNGGVFEIYTSRHTLIRVDAGDTTIYYRKRHFLDLNGNPFTAPGSTHSSIQMTAGFGLRF
jgi:hypothetical protein